MTTPAVEHPLDLAARLLGGRIAMGQLLCVKPSAIGNWKTRGVPWEHCPAIERMTNGHVSRQALRPRDWRLMWPELADPETNRPQAPASPAPAAITVAVGEGADA